MLDLLHGPCRYVCLELHEANSTALPRVYCEAYADVAAQTDMSSADLVLSKKNRQLWEHYRALAAQETRAHNVHFVGHFAQHEQFDPARSVGHALTAFKTLLNGGKQLQLPEVSLQQQATSRTMAINVIISVYRESLSWLSGFCKALMSIQGATRHFVIYSKHEQNTHHSLALLLAGCASSVDVVQLPNVGREGHSWLVYMLTRERHFGDVNIFLQGKREVHKAEVITNAVQHQQQLLFKGNNTQASSTSNRQLDIQDFGGACPLPLRSDISNTSVLNRLHYLALGPQRQGWTFHVNVVSQANARRVL